MPLFRFRHYGSTSAVPQHYGLTEPNLENAFLQRDAFLFRNPGAKYVAKSMEEFRVTAWHKVPDPSDDDTLPGLTMMNRIVREEGERISVSPQTHPFNDHMR